VVLLSIHTNQANILHMKHFTSNFLFTIIDNLHDISVCIRHNLICR